MIGSSLPSIRWRLWTIDLKQPANMATEAESYTALRGSAQNSRAAPADGLQPF
jgi:hypothetical protein